MHACQRDAVHNLGYKGYIGFTSAAADLRCTEHTTLLLQTSDCTTKTVHCNQNVFSANWTQSIE